MRTSVPAGFAPLVVVAIVAAVGAVAWLVKPSLFPGGAKRAANSTAATAKLEAATKAQGSAAAASIAKVGEVAATLPPSPAKDFIGREIPRALSLLPAPDPMQLVEAERRRAAVMEGRALEAEKLYATSAREAERMQRERDDALAARRTADLKLEEAAAAEHARTVQVLIVGSIAALLAAGWVWAKVNGISPEIVGRMKADIHAGANPVQSIEKYLAPRFHDVVERVARLKTPLKPVETAK